MKTHKILEVIKLNLTNNVFFKLRVYIYYLESYYLLYKKRNQNFVLVYAFPI